MNTTLAQKTEDDIHLSAAQTLPSRALESRGSNPGRPPTRPEQPDQLLSMGLKRLDNVPVLCPLTRLSDTEAILVVMGPDMTQVLHWVAGFLWKNYDLDIVTSFGAQLSLGQGTDLLVGGRKEQLDALETDLRQRNERVTLSGYKFVPAMYYRLRFSAFHRPELTYLLTGCLNRLNLNIEEFSTARHRVSSRVYALFDMRLEVPRSVSPTMMDQLNAELTNLDRSAQVDLEPEPPDDLNS